MPLAWPPQVSDPWSDPVSWDTVYISNVPWGTNYLAGGKILVKGATRFFKWDWKEAKGQDGTNPTYIGIRPKPFKLIFGIWTPEQWAYFNNNILPFFYYSGVIGKVFPLPIAHPATAVCNISSIVVEDFGDLEIDEHTKLMTFQVAVREYLPAAVGNASVTPVGPSPNAGPKKPGIVANPKIVELNQQNAALENNVANLLNTLP